MISLKKLSRRFFYSLGLGFGLEESLSELFGGAEADGSGFGDFDRLLGDGMRDGLGGPLDGLEGAQSAQFDSPFLH